MDSHIVKTGSRSIIIGSGHYGNYIPIKEKKVLKITRISEKHNEFINLKIVKTIPNYTDYYSIPDDLAHLIIPSDKMYEYIKNLVKNEDINIFGGPLTCYYVDYAGNKELLDTINDINVSDFSFWKSYKTILKFTKKILDGLSFLHNKQLCHLDIKPENIMIDTIKKTYKIIDFGFCSKEPFDHYVNNIRGTPGYFPYNYTDIIKPWLPKINTNDLHIIDGEYLIKKYRNLVYKIDSFCLGRVLYFLKYSYDKKIIYSCFNCFGEINNGLKLDEIIKDLIESDAFNRLTIDECINKYF